MCQRICRLCLKNLDTDDPDVRSILDELIQRALKSVFPFEIQFSDDLPMYTCKQCSWNVLDFHNYSEIVQKNQEKFDCKYLPDKISARHYNEMEKENIGLNNNPKELPLSMSEEYFKTDDVTIVNCKAELDDIAVANEIHPDLMEFFYGNIEEENASITCGNYEITSFVYEDPTECAESLNICNNLNNTPVAENNTTGSDSAINKKEDYNSRGLPNNKAKNLKKFDTTFKPRKSNKSLTLKTNIEHSCNKCKKKFKLKKNLMRHKKSYCFDTCAICKKMLKHKSMRKHLATHKELFCCYVCGKSHKNKETLEHHIETIHHTYLKEQEQ